jgi:aromatic ring-cleaving dioxygenase
VTVLRGYENAWQRPPRVRRLGDGTTRQSGRTRNQIAFPPALLASFLPWLMLNREGLSILLHPGTGDAYADHIDHAVWLGSRCRCGERSAKVAEDAVTFLKDLRCPPE